MNIEIFGIVFDEMKNSLTTDDNLLTIYDTEEKEQSFSFYTLDIEKYAKLFSKFNCVAVGISAIPEQEVLNLDDIKYDERIVKFTINAHYFPVQFAFSSDRQYFPNLCELSILGQCPETFIDLSKIASLEKLTIQYDKHFLEHWINLKQVKDLVIYDYDEADLTPLKGLTGLVRLKIIRGKMKSLDGLELLPHLETLFAGLASKLVDLDAILCSAQLKNIMFELYKKTTDWSFLAEKKDLRCISLAVADSVDFRKELPELEFLFVKKVKSRKNRSFLFSVEMYEGMTPDGIDVNYLPSHDAFYQPLDVLSARKLKK